MPAVERGHDREDADVQHHHRHQELDQAEACSRSGAARARVSYRQPPGVPQAARIPLPIRTPVWRHTLTARSMRRAWSWRARSTRPDLDAAREQLRVRGLLAELLEELPASGEEGVRTVFKKIKPKTLQIFSRQFATMIEAGLNVVSSLVILEEQTDDPYFALRDQARSAPTSRAVCCSRRRSPAIRRSSRRLYVAMVEAGEAAGILDTGARPRRATRSRRRRRSGAA